MCTLTSDFQGVYLTCHHPCNWPAAQQISWDNREDRERERTPSLRTLKPLKLIKIMQFLCPIEPQKQGYLATILIGTFFCPSGVWIKRTPIRMQS